MFWIILTMAATWPACSPSMAPAATTAPVASMVPPIQAPPTIGSIPIASMNNGISTIMATVKMSVMPTARVSSSFFARTAAAVAIAADTPHTEVAVAMMMTSDGLLIFSTRMPNRYMKKMTTGVTSQATNSPGGPRLRIRIKRISAPSSTRPVLMKNSLRSAGLIQPGVPTLFETTRPSSSAQKA